MSCSAETIKEAVDICKTANNILSQGVFDLRKWNSNSKLLLCEIEHLEKPVSQNKEAVSSVMEDEQSYTKYSVGLPSHESISKVLGVQWDSDSDQLCLEFSQKIELVTSLPPTKRSLLKLAAKIFDPLGCMSPFTINLKVLFQNFCLE